MGSLLVGYAFVLLLVTVGLVSLTVYAWNRRDHTGGTALTVLLAGLAVWCLCTSAGVLTRSTEQALLWAHGVFVGVVFVVAGLTVFALAYTGHDEYLGPRTYALLAVEPLGLFGSIVFGPDGLVYRVSGPTGDGMYGWLLGYGPVYWGHLVYSYLLIGVSSALILHFAFVSNDVYRRQVYAVLLAILLPWFGSFVTTFGEVRVTLTPLLFGATGIVLTWAFFRGRLLDISPVAYREVVESLNSAVFVVGTDDRIIEVNDAGRCLLGGDVEVGETVESALDDWPELVERYEHIAHSVGERRETIEQSDRYFDVQLTPLYDSRESFVGRVFLVHEITEQKEREAELERRNRQLDQFAAVVSHDLRNPLSVASGRLALARERDDPEEFERVEAAHERMSRLIDEVLAFARDENSTDATDLRLSSLARSAWGHVDTADATLQIADDCDVVGDRDQLLQLFENVFRNSVEHGGETVTVTVSGTADGFAIADDGPGVQTAGSDVFEHGVTSSENGTGLGLAIVEHIADAHGWSVEMTESDAGGARLEIGGVESRAVSA